MDLTNTIIIFVMILLNVGMIALKIPLLNIIFALVSFSIVGMSVGYDTTELAFSPYPQLLLLLVAVISLYSAATDYRRN